MRQLRRMGCHYGQGYFFSKPLDGLAIADLVEKAPQW
jgi:EAL domain-containing protein (putative c-di-GMP-specific phosphodiesterase class I)